jgi:hypothetical protein
MLEQGPRRRANRARRTFALPALSYVYQSAIVWSPELNISIPLPERSGFHQLPWTNGERWSIVPAAATCTATNARAAMKLPICLMAGNGAGRADILRKTGTWKVTTRLRRERGRVGFLEERR